MPLPPIPADCHSDPWDQIYAAKGAAGVSWYQPSPSRSLQWIEALAPERSSALIDVGAGASTLVDGLLKRGYQDISVLDRSALGLALSRSRVLANEDLAPLIARAHWLHGDLLELALPAHRFDCWHDRAVFHFLTTDLERQRYRRQLQHALRPGGHVVVATFAEDGPQRCSGRPVIRYSPAELASALGAGFSLLHHAHDHHLTPSGAQQSFLYACFVSTSVS